MEFRKRKSRPTRPILIYQGKSLICIIGSTAVDHGRQPRTAVMALNLNYFVSHSRTRLIICFMHFFFCTTSVYVTYDIMIFDATLDKNILKTFRLNLQSPGTRYLSVSDSFNAQPKGRWCATSKTYQTINDVHCTLHLIISLFTIVISKYLYYVYVTI